MYWIIFQVGPKQAHVKSSLPKKLDHDNVGYLATTKEEYAVVFDDIMTKYELSSVELEKMQENARMRSVKMFSESVFENDVLIKLRKVLNR